MKDRTPQEKKALSLTRDRRNTYGENDKASRRLIPLRKAGVNRNYRREVNKVLGRAAGGVEPESADVLETAVRNVKRNDWKKQPDAPLGDLIAANLDQRQSHAGHGKTALRKAREFVAELEIETKRAPDGGWIATAVGIDGVDRNGDTKESAIEGCRSLARNVFLETLGAVEILEVGDNSISVLSR